MQNRKKNNHFARKLGAEGSRPFCYYCNSVNNFSGFLKAGREILLGGVGINVANQQNSGLSSFEFVFVRIALKGKIIGSILLFNLELVREIKNSYLVSFSFWPSGSRIFHCLRRRNGRIRLRG